jgi:hypothetical protein
MYIEEPINTKFFGLQIDNHLKKKNQVMQLDRCLISEALTQTNQFIFSTFSR